MVQMMEVRRKFFMGTISVLSLECHNILEGLERWSRELVAAILCEVYLQRQKGVVGGGIIRSEGRWGKEEKC